MDIEKTENKIIELIETNQLTFSGELNILQSLVQKFELKTISNYAKKNNISYNGVKKMIKEERIQNFSINGIKYIF